MIRNIHVAEILKLSIEKRMLAAEEILDSIKTDIPGIKPEQLEMLEKRIEEYHADPSTVISWKEAKEKLAIARTK